MIRVDCGNTLIEVAQECQPAIFVGGCIAAGYPLDSPQGIREIPQLLAQFQTTEATRRGLQTPISVEDLESVLSGE